VAVDGPVDDAIRATDENATSAIRIAADQALQWMCWAAANGGAHGRRRGIAHGRTATWLAAAIACDLLDDGDLPDGNVLGDGLKTLEWWTWGDLDHTTGWDLRLAVHDPVDNTSIAINAHDSVD
jgi:hypothetical protein